MEKDIHEYEDIINLPHHQSSIRSHMSNYDRAAQFAPFAALTGYGDVVKETERLTEGRAGLYEEEKAALDEKLHFVLQNGQQASITYFKPDRRKSGGAYLSASRNIKKLDGLERILVMEDGTMILLDDILDIQADLSDDWQGSDM